MSNKVLSHLQADHAGFERFFRAIEDECTRLESGQQADRARLKAIAGYLGKHALPRHHAFEDAIFAQILTHVPRLKLDVYDLMEDHDIGRRKFKSFARAVETNGAELVEAARSYIVHERGHFISEEEIVFRYAATYLTPDQWQLLKDRKDAVREENGLPENLAPIADLLA